MRNLCLRRVSEPERYSVWKTDGLCMPAQIHGVGVVWDGGCMWEPKVDGRVEGEDYQRDGGRGFCAEQSVDLMSVHWEIWLGCH